MNKIDIFSPIDNSFIASVEAMTKNDIDKKVTNLKKAFESFKDMPLVKRIEYIRKAIDELEKNEERLAKILTLEISKSYKDSLAEIRRSVEISRYTMDKAMHLEMEAYSGEALLSNDLSLVFREPLGIILCIAPYNYPINLSLTKIIPALIMGNVVLFKPPTQGSFVSSEMVKILNEVLPKNVLEIVTGRGGEIGDYIVELDDISLINFTGSTNIGNGIKRKAKTTNLIMELGGKDSAIVLEDADLNMACKEIVSGAFSYSGQRCTAIKRVLVVDSVADKLASMLKDEISKLKVGNPFDNAYVTPLIDNKSADFVMSLIEDAINKGADLLLGNKREKNLVYPCLIDNVTLDMDLAFVEPFGPVLPIIRVKDEIEAIKIANMSEYGLQSSVFTKDIKKAFEIAKKLEVGTVQINKKTSRGPDNFPFLGIKDSGIGVQGVKYSLLSVSKIKSIVMEI